MKRHLYYSQRRKGKFYSRFFNRFTWRYWIIGALLLVVLIIVLIIVKTNTKLSSKDTPLYGKSQIVIGITTDVNNFGTLDASGQPSGFDHDVAVKLLSAIYPDKELFFMEIDSQQASYLLKEHTIDLAIGMFPENVLRTKGLLVSSSYFDDPVFAYVSHNSKYQDISSLQGQKLSVMTCDVHMETVKDFFSGRQMAPSYLACTSYPDGIFAVNVNSSQALIAPINKMIPYEGELERIDTPIGSAGYHILAYSGNSNTITLINEQITELHIGDTMDLMAAKWGVIRP